MSFRVESPIEMIRRKAIVVDCPYCGAVAGDVCTTPKGGTVYGPHFDRRRVADLASRKTSETR